MTTRRQLGVIVLTRAIQLRPVQAVQMRLARPMQVRVLPIQQPDSAQALK